VAGDALGDLRPVVAGRTNRSPAARA
jgi:hypothetical protein